MSTDITSYTTYLHYFMIYRSTSLSSYITFEATGAIKLDLTLI